MYLLCTYDVHCLCVPLFIPTSISAFPYTMSCQAFFFFKSHLQLPSHPIPSTPLLRQITMQLLDSLAPESESQARGVRLQICGSSLCSSRVGERYCSSRVTISRMFSRGCAFDRVAISRMFSRGCAFDRVAIHERSTASSICSGANRLVCRL
ncbi:hypothetical protein P167DRAFT_14426 [Morchella conica CCBAS932]|uniref:Uncharacterized protein n=1 Tax=Morchella conica CCBAS932 TaxID=1392247 RepID=A0A3N4LIS5_9PEZI|nr:hypothetical protein P167DRAFT_14426 [Morchella conica CCBAS932]